MLVRLIIVRALSKECFNWRNEPMSRAVIVLCMLAYVLASDVIELNDNNFDSVVKNSKFIVVEFYTNW